MAGVSRSMFRSRWAAVGAAVAVSVGAGGVFNSWAAPGSPSAASFVPITPCRLMDTRTGVFNVGPRNTPLGAGEVYAPTVRGTTGDCTIPATATAVSLNVTYANPSAGSFATVYPADKPRPNTSNLNWVAGQDPAPNAVTSQLSADGKLAFYNYAGTVNLVADIVGYYEPASSLLASALPSGQTIAGAWGGRYIAPQLAANNTYLISTSFPVRAPVPLGDADVNVAANAAAGDPDAACTGTADNPTAPPGKVCIYVSRANNASVTGFRLTDPGTGGTSPGDAYGFVVRILDAGTVGNTATVNAEGTWAYTAP